MRKDTEFNIKIEVENAVELQFADFELPLIECLRPAGYDDGRGGLFYPAIWQFIDQYVPGYLTEWNTAVAFMDWSRSDRKEAMQLATRIAGLSSERERGLRD